MKTSIILPAFNEEKRILTSINEISSYLEKSYSDYEIIVVNDGSYDDTAKIILQTDNPKVKLTSLYKNMGKGKAVKEGILLADGEFKIYTDADLAFSPHYIGEAIELLDCGAEVVAGVRAFSVEYPISRKIFSNSFSFVVNKTFGIDRDTQCGFKAFLGKAADNIFKYVTLTGFAFDVEVMVTAEKMGYKVVELPLVPKYYAGSTVHPAIDGIKMAGQLFKIYQNNIKGAYEGKKE